MPSHITAFTAVTLTVAAYGWTALNPENLSDFIGIVALVLTYVGTRIGRHAGAYLGQWAERIGGLVLIAIGCRILILHLMG